MLLRLLPTPSPSQPSPPTILFTLPLPASPYTSRALPLPANLLAHRSLCLQEDIDCSNVLLGDKASWISGIVDNVTFSLPHATIVVHLVDGSTMNVELSDECIALLHRVVNEVQLSFAAAASPAAPASVHESPRSSSERASASRSSLLYSILQPLLPSASTSAAPPPPAHVAVHMQPARAHRRQARSLLVNAYRRHVLPSIKERLPSAYLLWAIHSESTTKLDEYYGLRNDINGLLTNAGVDISSLQDEQPRSPLRRYQSPSGMPSPMSDSPTSSRSSSPDNSSSGPQNFLLAIPPAHVLPVKQRVVYSAQLTRLTQLASRVGSINKLASRYEREEGKRKWLEQLDLNRDADKALRRAFSNGTLTATNSLSAAPQRRSCLRNSTTAADLDVQARRLACQAAVSATVALEDILEATSDEDDVSEPELSDSRSSISASPEPTPTTPTTDRTSGFDDEVPLSPSPASRKLFEDAPQLIPSRSDDSEDWDVDSDLEMDAFSSRTPPLSFDGKKRVPLPPLPSQPQWRVQDVAGTY